jgi:hypothetical protein
MRSEAFIFTLSPSFFCARAKGRQRDNTFAVSSMLQEQTTAIPRSSSRVTSFSASALLNSPGSIAGQRYNGSLVPLSCSRTAELSSITCIFSGHFMLFFSGADEHPESRMGMASSNIFIVIASLYKNHDPNLLKIYYDLTSFAVEILKEILQFL